MNLFKALNVSASALTAERLRMDVVAGNIANINTTRTADGQPYRRKFVTQQERGQSFADLLVQQQAGTAPETGNGVQITSIQTDQSPFKLKYDPTSPEADANGMVKLPNVDLLQEITDMMLASRAYEANVTALNATKAMAMKSLEIGR
ncbi:MAG TPA: flagellar basal body rod protein FlgC [Symbiobacteriaceae bacterium]|jgi:flagellar basal-body rod protein FlgC